MHTVLDFENSVSLDGFFPSSQISARNRAKIINDPIYGHIEMDEYLVNVIDTDHFQRLHDCKQLGMSDRVFPGATHTRFEHSIGVAHLAGKQVTHLFHKQRGEIFESEEDYKSKKKIVELAGLVHDLGHGPLGHVFDLAFLRNALSESVQSITPEVHHEKRSVMLLRHLIDEKGLDLSRDEEIAIGELVIGHGSVFKEEPFMYQIVANEKNSLDVDKFDYIQRDTRNLNVRWGFDPDRLINASRVLGGELCYHRREVYTVYDMFTTRFKLHKVIYNHRTVKAVELMAVDALLAADSVLKISESITEPEHFLELSDSVLYVIERSKDPKLAKAKQILRRISRRDLYKFVDEVLIPPGVKQIKESDIASCQEDGLPPIDASDLSVYLIKANHGMGTRNPVENVDFYKTIEDVEPFRIQLSDISYVMPEIFEERLLRVYSKVQGKEESIKKAFRRCLHRMGITRETERSRKRHLSAAAE
mmetsp:Transcript_11117/g.46424  ORF Transcript_11117/g.46424 Transcript_11117/m.46424 type:complete len:476 (-) Transcript_11117:2069-3496(-)